MLCCSVYLVVVFFVIVSPHLRYGVFVVFFLTACVINSGTNKDLNFTQSPLFVDDFNYVYLSSFIINPLRCKLSIKNYYIKSAFDVKQFLLIQVVNACESCICNASRIQPTEAWFRSRYVQIFSPNFHLPVSYGVVVSWYELCLWERVFLINTTYIIRFLHRKVK